MIEAAERSAIAAADGAGVAVRPARELDDVAAVRDTLDAVWRDPEHVVPRELLLAVGRFGGVLLAAWDGDRCVGASLGFYATAPPDRATAGFHLHSHSTGVLASHRGRGVGLALKLAQRVAALRAGVDTVTWTFDPLLRPNARFNLERLGARGVAYEPDLYGRRDDVFNAGDLTDRLVVAWPVAEARVQRRLDEQEPPTAPPGTDARLLVVADDDGPRRTDAPLDANRPAWVATPEDAVSLRATDPDRARRWRLLVRDALRPALAAGMVIEGFAAPGWHQLQPRSSP